jgi:hypothetical protein
MKLLRDISVSAGLGFCNNGKCQVSYYLVTHAHAVDVVQKMWYDVMNYDIVTHGRSFVEDELALVTTFARSSNRVWITPARWNCWCFSIPRAVGEILYLSRSSTSSSYAPFACCRRQLRGYFVVILLPHLILHVDGWNRQTMSSSKPAIAFTVSDSMALNGRLKSLGWSVLERTNLKTRSRLLWSPQGRLFYSVSMPWNSFTLWKRTTVMRTKHLRSLWLWVIRSQG